MIDSIPAFLMRLLRDLAGWLSKASVYATVGAAGGGIIGLIGDWMGRSISLWFVVGFLVCAAVQYVWFTSLWSMERDLKRYQQWKQYKRISQAEYDELVASCLSWYKARRFGTLEVRADSQPPRPPTGTAEG